MYRGLAEAAWIGALYGTTTFLPISRGGHLALAEMLFDGGRITASVQMGFLLGTLGATVLLTRQSIGNLGPALARALRRPATLSTTPAGRDLTTIGLAQIPLGALWFLLGDTEDSLGRQPVAVAIGLFLMTLILLSTAWVTRGERPHLSWVQSLLMGLGQGLAVFPGLSVSGCTIAIAMWFGLPARRCFELAMLVSMPAMLVAIVRLRTAATNTDSPLAVMLVAMAVTLLTGLGAGRLLRIAVMRGRIAWFSMWLAPLAIATFAFARAWPGR